MGDSDQEDYPLFTLPSAGKPIVVSVSVNKVDLSMELDTGASLSIMSKDTYSSLSSTLPPISPSHVILTTYTGEKIKPVGAIDVDVRYQSQTATLPLVIVPGNGPTLLGRKVLQKHAPVFRSELGKLRDFTAKIHVQSDAKPKFYRPRPVALSLRQKVFDEIDRLRGLGVITPVKYSEWAAPIVPIVKTDGSIRLCGDYKVTVNPVLLTDTYPLPRSEDLFAALAGGKIFSKLDLKHAYLQIPLDEASKKFTTINTPKGLFQYERLPFGVSSAPSLFQPCMCLHRRHTRYWY
uniref:Peptidase A2 domain-containing protein n=1 Tax=Amphimedon queenslandica TaxID=400682 RepID=A0A1X7T2S0_AMPQE